VGKEESRKVCCYRFEGSKGRGFVCCCVAVLGDFGSASRRRCVESAHLGRKQLVLVIEAQKPISVSIHSLIRNSGFDNACREKACDSCSCLEGSRLSVHRQSGGRLDVASLGLLF
jgi:hypothetical protein